jgi:aerobic C4-dicarboxylate transport protein
VLAATLGSTGTIPVASIALILGVDRFMSEARALTNLIGNGVATIVVAKWTGDVDTERMRAILDNESEEAAEEPEAILDEVEEHMPASAPGKLRPAAPEAKIVG